VPIGLKYGNLNILALSRPIKGLFYLYIKYVRVSNAMANYPEELVQDAVCQSHTGHMTGLWFLPSPAFKAEY